MFEEYVEHPSEFDTGQSVAIPIHYQGFEPSLSYDDFNGLHNVVGDNPNLEDLYDAGSAPLFDLQEMQYPIQAPIIAVAVSSDILVMGLTGNLVVIVELTRPEQALRLQISRKSNEMTIYKIFLDPSGRHLIVSSEQGENWYYFRGWKRFKLLKNFSKIIIQSVAWNKAHLLSLSHSTSSGEMLIGTRNGVLYEALLDAEDDFFKSQERYLHAVYSLSERHAITGIRFDFYPPTDPRRIVVIMATSSRLYQFVGNYDRRSDDGLRLFSVLFGRYKDLTPDITELPASSFQSDVQFFTQSNDEKSLPNAIAWMTADGTYHGTLNLASTSGNFIDSARLLPYPDLNAMHSAQSQLKDHHLNQPFALALTDFHFVYVYNDRITVVSNLNDRVVYQESLSLKANEQLRGIAVDSVCKTYWIYTNFSLYELVSSNESRDVWEIYRTKGMYELALKFSKTSYQRDSILTAQAGRFFTDAQYIRSAQCYAQCSEDFETIILKFIDVNEREALRYYLIARLERTRRTETVQRMMLSTWLVELYLSRCNELEDIIASESVSRDVENLQALKAFHEDEMRQFFETYKSDFDQATIIELIQCHGRADLVSYFASIVGDFALVIEQWVLQEQWVKALDVLSRQIDLELYYRFAPVLMRHVPKETVDLWLRQYSLDPARLLPSLLHLQDLPSDSKLPDNAVRYLNHVIFTEHRTSSTIHNLLITFYVSKWFPSDEPLLHFFDTAPSDVVTGKPYFDLDYALRLCIQAGRMKPCVHIYSKMNLWENSVDLALEKNDLELAKINADIPGDDHPLRKKLWLKIAKYIVQNQNDIKAAMALLENTELLKIEDILPFFPDFVIIDDFKEEICVALERYSVQIDGLKKDMDEANRDAEAISDEIERLRSRFITFSTGEFCSKCNTPLLSRQFYVFPCQHSFHADCLIKLVKQYLPPYVLRLILKLETDLVKTAQMVVNGNDYGVDIPSLQNKTQYNLLSSKLTNPVRSGARGINGLGRNILTASDKLRELIVPESLASVISSTMWSTGLDKISMGMLPTSRGEINTYVQKLRKAREELEDLLASACPVCEGALLGLDKSFIQEGGEDVSWQI